MGKLIMCHLEKDDENLSVKISEIQRIEKLPGAVSEVIKSNFVGYRLNKSGLPSCTYVGPNRILLVGAFSYGEVSFVEVEGKWKNIVDGDELHLIYPYRKDKTYSELREGVSEYIDEQKEKYPDGLKVE